MYYLWMKQQGEGCDYTIGCGESMYELEGVDNLDNAIAAAEECVRKYGLEEQAIEQAIILVKSVDVDVEKIHAEMVEERLQHKKKKQDAAERAEFERLKAKFS